MTGFETTKLEEIYFIPLKAQFSDQLILRFTRKTFQCKHQKKMLTDVFISE